MIRWPNISFLLKKQLFRKPLQDKHTSDTNSKVLSFLFITIIELCQNTK